MTARCASRCPAAAVTLARACQRGSSASFDEDGTLGQIACKVQLLRNVPSDLAVIGHGEPAAWLVMPMPKQIAAPMASEKQPSAQLANATAYHKAALLSRRFPLTQAGNSNFPKASMRHREPEDLKPWPAAIHTLPFPPLLHPALSPLCRRTLTFKRACCG